MNVLLMLIGVLIVYYIILMIYRKNWNKGLSLDISFSSKHAVKGETVNLVEVVTNDKWLVLPFIHLKFEINRELIFKENDENSKISDKTYRNDVFSLLFHQKITRRIPVVCDARGVYRITEAQLIFSGPFMSEIMIAKKKVDAEITVYPRSEDAELLEVVSNRLEGDLERQSYIYSDRFMFRGIRQYQSFDSIRDVNWKTSAKNSELMVNQYNDTINKKVCILLNLESDGMLKYKALGEMSISFAAGIAQKLIEEGISVSVISNGKDIDTDENINVSFGSDYTHLNIINTALARIDMNKEQDEFADVIENIMDIESRDNCVQDDEDCVYIVISESRRKKLQENISRLLYKQDEIIWLLPYHNDMSVELEYCDIKPVCVKVDY